MQQGGSQYGVPPTDMTTQFSSSSGGGTSGAARPQMLGISATAGQLQQQQLPLAEAASPISSRPPPPHQTVGRGAASNYEELVPGGVGGGFGEDDALAAAAGEEGERGGAPGNRWPRQETLALLKIRSEMDTAFRDATLKGPLWEDVSRKLAELGYNRSAKKCKEKFENVHKYYKRTKEGRAGRQDGKSYRFFSQLEALHTGAGAAASPSSAPMASQSPVATVGPSSRAPPQAATPISAISPPPLKNPPSTRMPAAAEHIATAGAGGISTAAAAAGISFSSSTSSSSSDASDDEETEEGIGGAQESSRKRKRDGGGSSSGRKMMAFFEGLMKQVMERQEQMQQRFLETIEKREQDRMIREEAWRRQEMARLTREHELMAQERAMAANRDAAVIAFLQNVTGQTVQLPVVTAPPPPQPQPSPKALAPQPQYKPPPPPPSQPAPAAAPQDQQVQQTPHQRSAPSTSSLDLATLPEPQEMTPASGGYEGVASSSRWPKAEVHALIKLRSGLDTRYQEAGPKGPLWEEISSEMHKLGYNRSSKRCKEKWENINKYFKKVKESNKKRPEDAKTCPYFHQLDALYRKKQLGSSAAGGASSSSPGSNQRQQDQHTAQEMSGIFSATPPPDTAAPPQPEAGAKNGENNDGNGIQTQTSNGSGLSPSFFEEGDTGKKPEDIMKELMDLQQHQAVMDEYDKRDEGDSDNMDEDYDDDDEEEEEEDRKMQYKIQFQRQTGSGNGTTATGNPSAKPATTAAGSFLAMVQ